MREDTFATGAVPGAHPGPGLPPVRMTGTPRPRAAGETGGPLPDGWPEDLDPFALAELAVLRKVLDVAVDSVVVTEAEPVSGDGPRIVWVNRAFEQHTGWTLEEVRGRTPRLLQGPGTDRATLDEVRRRLEAWQTVDVELLNYTKDGRPFWVHMLIAPLADETGWFTHWVSVQRDVTARREAELLRQREHAFLDGVLSSITAQTAVLDRHGRIVAVNQAWEEFWLANGGVGAAGEGTDYLAACAPDGLDGDPVETGQGALGCSEGVLAARGIRAVLEGRAPRFSLDYECSSPARQAWFHCEVVPLRPPRGAADLDGGCVVTHTDITERVLAERALAHRATHDQLTGLANRDWLSRHLAERSADPRAARTSLLFCDLDDFKLVNDSLGHDAGDELLRQVARRLLDVAGEGTVCRLGGDEFVVVQPGDAAAAAALAARVHEALRAPVRLGGIEVAVSTSIGVAEVTGQDASAVLAAADAAMYRAKALGRSRTEVFSLELQGEAERRLDVVAGLRRTLDALTAGPGGDGAVSPAAGALRLHRQPIVSLRTGEVRAYEALLRWERDGVLVPPGQFLPVVVGTELAVELDMWVLRTVCRGLRDDTGGGRRGARRPRVSVNAGARTLADRRYLDLLRAELADAPRLGQRLALEVTEEAAVLEDVAHVLEAVRALGVRVSLDDFGTGWSSLTNLVRLPVDVLKVDRLFVERLDSREGQAVIGAVVSMAASLGLSVVAEGIETELQRDQVLALGGLLGQGFLFGRPEPWL